MIVKIKKGLAYRRIASEVFIVDAAKAEMHELNGSAALIWEGLAAGKKEDALVSALEAEFETDAKTARAGVKAFIEELLAARLIEKI